MAISTKVQLVSGPGESLGRLAFFHGADPILLATAARSAVWISHGPEELVLDFGDASQDVFLIVEGAVRALIRTPLGQEMIICDLGAGDIFGEVAAIDGATRSASVTALRATRLCRLPAEAFLNLALQSPTVGLRLLRVLTARLRREDQRLFELATLPARERLAAELLRLSRPRADGSRVISPPPPQHVLAARIGARRETVSLALNSLVREGLMEVTPRAITLPLQEKLRAVTDARLQGDAVSGKNRGRA
jgi:CRP/FNR family transcriptional regulator, cyclic AMP receptor protein